MSCLSIFWQDKEVKELNDRKISKLCEYASRNPLRIPKVQRSTRDETHTQVDWLKEKIDISSLFA
ncbi:hypothetical protein RHMOL_Rhmol10G0291400 [Rhododendron molle]|uniref:Uncharacterized protein n=2 Tax=Rhododendron molle TaxID=49168 RepID=A0ACC0M7K4_RHOML|nr:hypothetical protein RHMOL_Rhmol10G0291400 [Rhododendron molle]KAI8536887.1 hypothetical protein RHMOL_Rhmol10G0291400 [Rhododendron molle]